MKKQRLPIKESWQMSQLTFYALAGFIFFMTVIPTSRAMAQGKPVSGKIIDSVTNQPLGGVTIVVENSPVGTVSDADGDFKLNVPDGSVLQVSMINYKSVTV